MKGHRYEAVHAAFDDDLVETLKAAAEERVLAEEPAAADPEAFGRFVRGETAVAKVAAIRAAAEASAPAALLEAEVAQHLRDALHAKTAKLQAFIDGASRDKE